MEEKERQYAQEERSENAVTVNGDETPAQNAATTNGNETPVQNAATTNGNETPVQDAQAGNAVTTKKKREGVYYNDRAQEELDAMQRKKTLYMYLSTLLFAVSLFLPVEGRTYLSENGKLFALFTAYVMLELALIVFTVYIAIMGRTGQKIAPQIKEKYVQKNGLDRFTFRSYEWFNAVHFVLAAAEIAVSLYKINAVGAKDIAVAVLNCLVCAGYAAFSLLSRNVLYKANAHHVVLRRADGGQD